MATMTAAKLRRMLLKFYQEHDPVVLQQGFDISGLVDYTMDNGLGSLNAMLLKKYGKEIDMEDEEEDARAAFNRMSVGLTMSTQIMKKEHEYQEQLYRFFNKHDPQMVSPAREQQFEKFIKFAMLNGISKLSEKLKQKYGEGIEGSGKTAEMVNDFDANDAQFGNSGLNPFKLEVDRLRNDLQFFFTEMEDEQQLEMLDEMTDWACQIGVEEFDGKMYQMYGISLNDFLNSNNRANHKNHVKDSAPKNAYPSEQNEYGEMKKGGEDEEMESYYEEVEEEYEVHNRGFESMTDNEIKAELTHFYNRHDPDNLEKLDQVLMLSRNLGRDGLNEKLNQIYGESLYSVPVKKIRTVKQKFYRAKPVPVAPVHSLTPVQQETGHWEQPPPQQEENNYAADNGYDNYNAPPPQQTYQENYQDDQPPPPNTSFKPVGGVPEHHQKQNLAAELSAAVINRPKQTMKQVAPPQPKAWGYVEEEEELNEFQKMQKAMKERIINGKARVRDHNGEVMEVNILIDVCKNYRLDISAGICVCGFAKNDHIWGSKKFKKR